MCRADATFLGVSEAEPGELGPLGVGSRVDDGKVREASRITLIHLSLVEGRTIGA